MNSGEHGVRALSTATKDAEEKLLDRFRDPTDPLKILIVTTKLLTGFDAPILQAMYLDKPMKDHNLLQAICRTNRTYGRGEDPRPDRGLHRHLRRRGPGARLRREGRAAGRLEHRRAGQGAAAAHAEVPRLLPRRGPQPGGYEGLIAAQQCLPNNDVRDKFAADFSVLARIWEALSPDPVLTPYETDYRWLTQVYESVKPPTGNGRLLWHALGAKTIELINENVHVESVRDDLDTLVMDAEVLEAVLGNPIPRRRPRKSRSSSRRRLRKHAGNPKFKALGERLEELKERHEQGLLLSIEFLKELLELAKDVVKTERETPPEEEHRPRQGRADRAVRGSQER